MATGKVYYWIKIKESFMTSDKVDFLMSQKDGANYVVLYQMLCLKTINTNGELCRKVGEIMIPYDVEKIKRDCKWFSRDTIIVALELYKKLGLIFMQDNGVLALADFGNMVGKETDWALQKRNQKAIKNESCGNKVESGVENFHIEYRDKNNIIINNNILSFWNKKEIIKHKKSEKIVEIINKKLKDFSEKEILTSIDHYAEIYHDKEYFFKYKWSLEQFMTQKNCLKDFLDDGVKWLNYVEWKTKGNTLKTKGETLLPDYMVDKQNFEEKDPEVVNVSKGVIDFMDEVFGNKKGK